MFTKTAIKRPVTTIMCILIVILAGLISYSGLKLDLMPTMDIPIAIVSTTYVGAGPEEIESLITKPIESALGTVSNIDTISSTSSSNSSMVMIQFQDGTDIDVAATDMREKIDMIKGGLPDGADDPLVLKLDINAMSSIVVGVYGDMEISQMTTFIEDNIQNKLERIDGVASVDLIGSSENQIEVEVIPEMMQGYGISTSQVANVLKSENINLPAGKIRQGDSKLQIRSVGEFKSLDEIKNIPITTASGGFIRLSDIANVREVEKEIESYAIINGKQGIGLSIQKQSDSNIVEISDKVTKELDKLSAQYKQVSIMTLSNTSDYIKTSLNNVLSTAIQAAIMAMIVLFVFLRNTKSSLIIGVSIPTSVIATFGLMYLSKMSLNIISLGGITIGIGMLVDNSVVVLENIFRHYSKGEPPKEAAENGATEVSLSVMASTLTTVAVFIPLMFVKGTMGQMFKDLSLTVSFALFASLIVSLSFVPMQCAKALAKIEEQSKRKKHSFMEKFLDAWGRGLDKIDGGYRRILKWSLSHKKRIIVIVIASFIGSMMLIPIVGFELMPSMDEGAASISIEMPNGTLLDETTKVVNQVVDRISDLEETEEYYILVGGGLSFGSGGTDTASVNLNFIDKDKRKRTTDEIVIDIRSRIKDIAGADITVSASGSAMGSYSSGSDVEFQVNGEETDVLRNIGKELTKIIEARPEFSEVTTSMDDSVPEASIKIDRERASKYGVTTSAVANAVNTAITGSTATQYKINGTEIDVVIKQSKERVEYINDLQKITVPSQAGDIPLTEVADVQIKDGAVSIPRKDMHKYITIGANIHDIDAGTAQTILTQIVNSYELPEGYDFQFTGDLETMIETFTSLLLALVVAILLVYMIMASQFESLIYPFIVLFSVPLGISGGILGLFITRQHIATTSFMGFIMLVGMVVNNAIVLIDYTNQLVDKGMSCNEALIEAGPTRLRPILMTTLTTVIGLVPMAIAMSEGTEMQRPMAIVVIFGLTLSTLVTLIFIPVLYSSVEILRKRSFKKRKLSRKEKKKLTEAPKL